ncbi:MAG: hypothetical protein MI861_18610, partial [Pirellulales bacterium]|nr:hypothetical protein [Pirellulales bacterium]
SNGRRLPDHSWQSGVRPVEIASWTHDGVDYQWMLLGNASRLLDESGDMPVGFHIHTRDALQESLKKAGKPWMLQAQKDVLTLKVPEIAEPLDTVLEDVYDQILHLGDGSWQGSPVLNLQLEKWSEAKIQAEIARGVPEREARNMLTQLSGHTFDTSLHQWQQAVRQRLSR